MEREPSTDPVGMDVCSTRPDEKENPTPNTGGNKQDDITTSAATTAAMASNVDDKEFSFTYVLPNYRAIDKIKIYSPYHCFGGFKWRLLIFPSGNQTKSELSVYLECGGPVLPDEKRLTDDSAGVATDYALARHQSPTHTWSRSARFWLQLVHPSKWVEAGVNFPGLRTRAEEPTTGPVTSQDGVGDQVAPTTTLSAMAGDNTHLQQRRTVPGDITKDASHTFRERESDWGFCEFAPFSTLRPGLHSDDDYNVVIKVCIRLEDLYDAAHNISWDSRKETGYVGFKNQGATCYMNSLLQTLYMLVAFRKAVYEMPLPDLENSDNDMTYALQKVFYELQFSPTVVKTKKLTESFGWETTDAFTQHDVQELNRILCDHLEEKMKKSDPKSPNKIQELFQGKLLNYIECVDVDFKSTREESFYDLSLNVKGCRNIIESFEKYTEVEFMDGDNKYRADGYEELQRAKKGAKFLKLPPVLQLHLKRFEYDFHRDAMVKINDRYEFATEINLSPYVQDSDGSDIYVLHSVLVHIGDVNGGHYHAFIRPHVEEKPGQDPTRWLKFDDEHVTNVSEENAVSENFGYGGEKDITLINANNGLKRGKLEMEDDITSIGLNGQTHPTALQPRARNLQSRRFMNAYMLQYLRKEHASQLLKPLAKEDIPKQLADRINNERQLDLKRQKERLEQHLYMTLAIATPLDLHQCDGSDLSDWEKCKTKRIKRALKLGELKLLLQKERIIRDASNVRIWKCVRRHNDTIRPEVLVADGDDSRPVSDSAPRDMLHNSYNMSMYNTRHYDQYAEEPFRIFVEDLCSEYSFGIGDAFIEARRHEEGKRLSESPLSNENGQTDCSTMDADEPETENTVDEVSVTGGLVSSLSSYPLRQYEILVFFKLYIPKPVPSIKFLGYAVVNKAKNIIQALAGLRRPLERYGVASDVGLVIWQEMQNGTVTEVSVDATFDSERVSRGDVLVVQAPYEANHKNKTYRMEESIPAGLDSWNYRQEPVREDDKDLPLGGRPMPSAKDFYSYLRLRIKVEFKDKAALGNDVNDVNVDDIIGICLELTKADSYLTMRKILANCIEGAHPDYLRFFAHDIQRQAPAQEPIRSADGDAILKLSSMHIMSPHLLASPLSRVDYRLLWYERTEYRLSEFEHKEEVRVVWRWDGGTKSSPGTSQVLTVSNPVAMQQSENAQNSTSTESANGPGNETSTTSDDVSLDDSTTDNSMPLGEKDVTSPPPAGGSSPVTEEVTQMFSVLVSPLSKYTSVIDGIRSRQRLDGSTKIRLLEVRNCRIERIIDAADQVPHMMVSYDYPVELRAEPTPPDETFEALGDEYQLVAVAHLAKERHRGGRNLFFGTPFLLRVRNTGLPINEIRELIRVKLGVKETEFETWKLAEVLMHTVEYLDDVDTVWSPSPRNSDADLCTLAVEHRCPTPRRYNSTHGRFADKPLKIRG